MSRPNDGEVALLRRVAVEVREVFEERGYRVGVALDTDSAFGSGRSRSSLMRDLVVDATTAAASRHGLDFRPVNGDGREFRFLAGQIDRRYRLLRARRLADRSLFIPASSDSALAVDDSDRTLFDQLMIEHWVLAWIATEDGQVDEILVAPIVGYVPGTPGYLALGTTITLDDERQTLGGGFQPTDENLDDYFDEDDEGGTQTESPAS